MRATRPRPAGHRLARYAVRGTLAALLGLLLLELAVRSLIDLQDLYPEGIHLVDPTKPIVFRPHASQTYSSPELTYTVSFNRFGRRDTEWSERTVADPRSILFIGDSFVIGNGVEHEETIPSRLEALLAARGDPREVLNFGMPKGNPLRYRLALEDALDLGFAADTIAVGIFIGNDFYPGVLSSATRAPAPRDPPPTAAQPARWPPVSHLKRYLRARLSQSPMLTGWALRITSALGIDLYDTPGSYIFLRRPTADQGMLFQKILDAVGDLAELSHENGRALRIVVFPNKLQVENGDDLDSSTLDSTRPNEHILVYCKKHKIACFDLLPVLKHAYETDGVPVFFAADRHLNPAGTQIAASAIVDFLARPTP